MRALARTLYEPVYRHWLRAEWDGLEHVPLEGGALLIANHAGAIPSDAPVVMHGIETELLRPVYGLAENLFRQLPVLGTLWSRAGGVPAHPDNAYRLLHDDSSSCSCSPRAPRPPASSCATATSSVASGAAGSSRSRCAPAYRSCRWRSSATKRPCPSSGRARASPRLLGLPYFPITANQFVYGPLLGYVLPLPAKFRIRVLPPITFDVEPGLPRYNRGMVMEQAERIRSLVQSEVDDLLRNRRSVWRG